MLYTVFVCIYIYMFFICFIHIFCIKTSFTHIYQCKFYYTHFVMQWTADIFSQHFLSSKQICMYDSNNIVKTMPEIMPLNRLNNHSVQQIQHNKKQIPNYLFKKYFTNKFFQQMQIIQLCWKAMNSFHNCK